MSNEEGRHGEASGRGGRRLTPLELGAWSGFLSTHAALVREIDARLSARHRMSFRVYDVLATLDMVRSRRLRMSDLAARVVLSPSRATRLVGELEEQGLVAREPDADDRRVFWAVLTPTGLQRLRAARRTHHEVVRERFTGRLADEDLGRLEEIWRRLGTTDPGLEEALASLRDPSDRDDRDDPATPDDAARAQDATAPAGP